MRSVGTCGSVCEAYADVLFFLVAVTTGKIMTLEELSSVKGRGWEDIDVSGVCYFFFTPPPKNVGMAHGRIFARFLFARDNVLYLFVRCLQFGIGLLLLRIVSFLSSLGGFPVLLFVKICIC
jgi:hypothetical protein